MVEVIHGVVIGLALRDVPRAQAGMPSERLRKSPNPLVTNEFHTLGIAQHAGVCRLNLLSFSLF